MSSMLRRAARLAFVVAFALAAQLTATPPTVSPWPAIESDLPAHPDLRYGTLRNGLRYLILPNAEPKNRVSLRLLVAVGSLHEDDHERGLAHFVEHMAFRGTRSHPAGSLSAALQRMGVGIGPDSAAFTSFDHTIYHLELPDPSDATVGDGLQALREFAEEVSFEPKLIELERGVILSELATRDTPAARSSNADLAFLWPDSRHVRRPIGGMAETIRAFQRSDFVAFYDAWYRPERMAIIVVGNIDAEKLPALLEKHLGGITARGTPRPEPTDLVPVAQRPDVAIFADPGLVGVTLTFQRPVPTPREADTHEHRVNALHRNLAFTALQNRLKAMAHEPGTSFVAPSVSLTPVLEGWRIATLSVGGRILDWKLVAADIEREHRRAFQFGFTARELTEAKASFTAAYEQAVRTSSTWPSDWLATRLAITLVTGTAFVRPIDAQKDIAEALAQASLEDCVRAFRETWSAAAPHVFVSAHPSFAITRAEIAAALNQSRATMVTARAEAFAMPFAYTDFGPAGQLAREQHVADLDLRLAEFANGVRLNHKHTTFEADTVEIHVRVGEGKLLQPANRPGLDYLANFAVTAGGLGRHTAQELARLLAGRSLMVSFRVDPDTCAFTARGSRRELDVCLQIIAAYLTDSAYRPELMRDARAAFNSMYVSLATSPSGPIAAQAWRILAGGDRRFGVPEVDELFSRHLDDLKAWLEPQFKQGAIELSVVGDVAWDDARASVARTLGALPARATQRIKTVDNAVQPPPRPNAAAHISPIDPTLKLCAIAWYWPTPPLQDIRDERRRDLLALVLDERCRLAIREELGAAYVTAARFDETPGFPSLTAFSVFTEVAPTHARQAMAIIQREAASLRKKGVTADEFERVRQPYLRARSDDLRTNVYWGRTVLSDAQQRPDRLAAARNRQSDTAAITAAELSRLARRYLEPTKAFRFATVPTAPARPPNAASAGSR